MFWYILQLVMSFSRTDTWLIHPALGSSQPYNELPGDRPPSTAAINDPLSIRRLFANDDPRVFVDVSPPG